MQSVTQLALHLDVVMLQARSVAIADENTPDGMLPLCKPADQLRERLLIKYLRFDEVEKYSIISGVSLFPGVHYVTPTPIAARDLMTVLALPPKERRSWALLLRPGNLSSVRGPRRIGGGIGIEYVIENGFSSADFADPPWPREYR